MSARLQRALSRLGQERPAWLALAEAVSLAVRVTPALLRRVRLQLLPALPVSAEAELWASALVAAAGPTGLTLHAEAATWLRGRLAGDAARLRAAWEITRALPAPPVVAAEQELTFLGLADPDDTGRMRAVLQEVLAGVAGGDRPGLAAWARRALPRLPPAVRRTPEAWLLALSDGVVVAPGVEPPADLIDAPLAVLGLAARPRARVSLRRVDGGLELAREDGPGVDVPDTGTVVLFVDRTALALGPGERRMVPWTAATLELGALDGSRWLLREGEGEAAGALDLSWWLQQPEPDSEAWRGALQRLLRAIPVGAGEVPSQELEGWASTGTGPFGVLRLAGPRGSGRSSLLAAAVRRLSQDGRAVAWHVFEPEIPESLDLQQAQASIRAQLAPFAGQEGAVLVLDGVDEAVRRLGDVIGALRPDGAMVLIADREANTEGSILGDAGLDPLTWATALRSHRPLTMRGFPLPDEQDPEGARALQRMTDGGLGRGDAGKASKERSPDVGWPGIPASVDPGEAVQRWLAGRVDLARGLGWLAVAREPLPPAVFDDDRLLPAVRVGPRGQWSLVEGLRGVMLDLLAEAPELYGPDPGVAQQPRGPSSKGARFAQAAQQQTWSEAEETGPSPRFVEPADRDALAGAHRTLADRLESLPAWRRHADRHAGWHRRQAGLAVLPDVPRLTRLARQGAACLWLADDVEHLGIPDPIRRDPDAAAAVLTSLLVAGGATPESARQRLCLGPGQPGWLTTSTTAGPVYARALRQLSVAESPAPAAKGASSDLTVLGLADDGVVEQITAEHRLEAAREVAGVAGPWIWDRHGAVHHALTMARAHPGRPDQPILAATLHGRDLVVATPEALVEVHADGRGASLRTLLDAPTAPGPQHLVATAWGTVWVRDGRLVALPRGLRAPLAGRPLGDDLRALLGTPDPLRVFTLSASGAVALWRVDRDEPPLRWHGPGRPSAWQAGGDSEMLLLTLGYPDGTSLRLLSVAAGFVEQPGLADPGGSAVTAILPGPGMTLLGHASGRLRWLADPSPPPRGVWGKGAVTCLLRVDAATAIVAWEDGALGRIDLGRHRVLPLPEADPVSDQLMQQLLDGGHPR